MTVSAIQRCLVVVPSLLVFFVFVFALSSLFRHLPVFDQQSRVEGIFGDWRIPRKEGLYDRSEYLFQIGFGFLQGDVVASAATESRTEIASIETALDRATNAKLALQNSASLAPGNAYTWCFLGWAHAMEGDVKGALDALGVSWKLAPYNVQLAPARINLLEVLVDIDAGVLSTKTVRIGASKDFEVLKMFEPVYLETALKDAPLLQQLSAASENHQGID